MSRFTDRTDEDVATSLHEYGCIRDPKTHRTLFCVPVRTGNPYYCSHTMKTRSTYVSEQDVYDALEELHDQKSGYFKFIGEPYEDILDGLDNEWLTPYITSLNDYNGWFIEHWMY